MWFNMQILQTILISFLAISVIAYLFSSLYLKTFLVESPTGDRWKSTQHLFKNVSMLLGLLVIINILYGIVQ